MEDTYGVPWTLERMTPAGRRRLREYGLSVPACRFPEPPVCPYCGSHDVALESLFGPTMCRATYLPILPPPLRTVQAAGGRLGVTRLQSTLEIRSPGGIRRTRA